MDAVTYPDQEVIELLNSEFLPVQLDTDLSKDLNIEFEVYWEPKFAIVNHRRLRIREWMGYLAPPEFLAELKLALGLNELRAGRNADAVARFERVVRDHPHTPAAPESLYWHGIAQYRMSNPRDKEILWQTWRTGLVARYGESVWAMKTTMLADPAGWPAKRRTSE